MKYFIVLVLAVSLVVGCGTKQEVKTNGDSIAVCDSVSDTLGIDTLVVDTNDAP